MAGVATREGGTASAAGRRAHGDRCHFCLFGALAIGLALLPETRHRRIDH
jgi:hypothetical protein